MATSLQVPSLKGPSNSEQVRQPSGESAVSLHLDFQSINHR